MCNNVCHRGFVLMERKIFKKFSRMTVGSLSEYLCALMILRTGDSTLLQINVL